MLRFVIGEKGSGKTEYCINDAMKRGGEALIIVPEQFSHNAETELVNKTGVFGLGSVEVLSFGQMARRILALSDNASMRHIDNAGKVMLLYKILREGDFTLLSGNEDKKAECIMKIIGEFKRYCVTPEDIKGAAEKCDGGMLKIKLWELYKAYAKFEECVRDNFINGDDNLERLANSEYAKKKYAGYNIYIDSFTSFTKAELACIEMFFGVAASVTVTICADAENLDKIHFSGCVATIEQIKNAAKRCGMKQESDVICKKSDGKEDIYYLAENYFSFKPVPYEKKPENMEIFMGKNLISEIEYAAANIRMLTKETGCYYRDFAVLCADAPLYGNYIKGIFEKYDIKVFPDTKTNVTNHPVASFIISVSDLIYRGYTYKNLFRCIKYDFFDITDEECDILENFALESGAEGSMWSSVDRWSEYVLSFLDKNYDESESVNLRGEAVIKIGKKVIEPLSKLRNELSASRSVKGKCKALYKFLEDISIREKLSDAAKYFESISDNYSAYEYKSVYNKIMDILDEMCDAVGESNISNENFAAILKVGIGQFEIGKIPAVRDGVICGDVQMAKELDVKYLFVLGMNDGVFPMAVSKSGFLNDFDRQKLEEFDVKMAPESRVTTIENEYLIYKIFTSPAEKIFFSYSMANMELSGLREAQAITKIKEVMPCIKMSDDVMGNNPVTELAAPKAGFEKMVLSMSGKKRQGDEYSTAYKWFSGQEEWQERTDNAVKMLEYKNIPTAISKEVTDKLYGEEMYTAVSRLEKFSSCPFSYFMRYVMKAEPRKEYKFRPKDAGTFLHGIIERFSQRLEDRDKTWKDADEAYIKSEISEILQENDGIIKRGLSFAGASGERAFVRLCKSAEFAISVMVMQINRGKFVPMGYEVKFSENGKIKPLTIELPYGRKIKLTGVIDRIDAVNTENGEYFRIIDYKTGNKKFDLGEIYSGLTLQLAVYMCAAANEGGKPAGMLYCRLAEPTLNVDPFLDEEQIKAEKQKQIKLSGLLVDTEEVLSSMDISEKFDFLPVRKLKSGKFSGDIASETNFRDLQKHVKKKVSQLAGEILKGRSDISPYKTGDKTACDFCDYADACKFDKMLGCNMRVLSGLKREEVWQMIGEEDEC